MKMIRCNTTLFLLRRLERALGIRLSAEQRKAVLKNAKNKEEQERMRKMYGLAQAIVRESQK